MVKRILCRGLDIKVVNMGNVFEEARRRGLTGFFRATYWDRDDFLLFVEGAPLKLISVRPDGRRIASPPEGFRLEEREGTATFVECTLDDIVGFQEYYHDPARAGALLLFPFGEVVQEPTSLSFLDPNKELMLAQRSHLSGYMAFYTRDKLIGVVVFQEGNPVAVLGGDASFGPRAVDYINANLSLTNGYMSMYTLDYEILSFMYSMHPDNIRPVNATFTLFHEAKEFISSQKMNALVLMEGGGIYRFDLFFMGQQVGRLVKDKGFFVDDEETANKLAVKVENMPDRNIKVYEVSLIEKPQPVDVSIKGSPQTAAAEDIYIPADKVGEVRSLFIKELGPVGRLIWEKTLREMGFSEESMGPAQMRMLIERLKKEFPEEELADEFIEKIGEIIPDIM